LSIDEEESRAYVALDVNPLISHFVFISTAALAVVDLLPGNCLF